MDHIAVFGANGERLLRQWGDFGEDQINYVGSCATLSVGEEGYPEHDDCSDESPLIERLKLPPKADDPTKCDLPPVRN